jgi:redox-sensitive bicupin YhaK (pirin superfamily)
MGFGALRVLNDDIIAPARGFDLHPHQNMEIITIPFEGKLEHKDSIGGSEIIHPGEVQVMSAGSGIIHSEYNASETDELKLFQIWIETAEKDVEPRHETRRFDLPANELVTLVSGSRNSDELFIHQEAKISRGKFSSGKEIGYSVPDGKGIFVISIAGQIEIAGEILKTRDSIEISDTDEIDIQIKDDADILIIEVPMED